jgi:cobalt-zinc-cadmium resistance protein CzcA
MINRIISFSIKNKLIIGLMVVALIGTGIHAMLTINLGSVPDITNNQVQVITVAPNLGTEDIEQFVTYPVELAMANLPDVVELRSISRFGLSVVTIVFEDRMGTYLPRQLVQEKLIGVQKSIPAGFGEPFMAPIATGLGEIYQYTLRPEPGYDSLFSATDLRTIQDWIVKRQMALVPGVIEVNTFGGELKQYEITLDPNKMNSMEITMSEIFEALENNNANTGGAYIEKNHQANFIRGEGLARSLEDLEMIVVKTINRAPVLIKDVANEVRYGAAIRFGALTADGRETVGGQILMLKGENPNNVIKNVEKRIKEIQKSLPEGLKIEPFLSRSDLIARTTSTVTKNLIEGALIVIFVLVVLLGSLRGGLITASIIPLSLLFAFILMKQFGVWANLMSLGAIDFGIIVDGAVIVVEGVVHHIEQRLKKGVNSFNDTDMDQIAYESASSVMNSAFFGQLIILIVFTPILFLTGIEGKMFQPMAYTFGFAVLGAIILSLTYVPMVAALFLKPAKEGKKGLFVKFESMIQRLSEKIMRFIHTGYEPVLKSALDYRKSVLAMALALLLISGFVFSNMGGEFIPKLDEGDIALQALIKPGSALTESIEVSKKMENIILDNFPEVKTVVARIGVAEIPTDPMPMDIADAYIILEKDMDKWVSASSKQELIDKIHDKISIIPGVNYVYTQPVELRFNELLTGVREDVAIKLYGEDLDVLAAKAQEMARIIGSVDGAADVRVEATSGLPQITVTYNRAKLAQYGLNIKKLNQYVSSAFAGASAGVIFEGEKRFDVVIRLSESYRQDINNLMDLFVDLPNGSQVPLKEVADISYKPGPMQISRDNTYRRIYVGVNVRGRDVETLIEEIQAKMDKELNLPTGYYITYGGSFENLKRAKERLSIVVPIALGLIFLLLYFALRSLSQSVMIYMAVPLAAIGGILFLAARGLPFSISAGVGFVVLFGVAVLNGLVLISRLNDLRDHGVTDLRQRILTATEERLRPILLTATAAIMGFTPMAISASAGAEVQRPLATVVIGGLITATILTLIVVPVLYYMVETRKEKRSGHRRMAGSTLAGGLALLLITGLSLQSVAQDTPAEQLSIEEAVTIALANNPQIKAADLGVTREEKLKKSVVDLGNTAIGYTQGEINAIGFVDNSLEISQRFKFPTVYGTRSKVQDSRIELSQQLVAVSKNELVRQVKQEYIQLAWAYSQLALYNRLDSIYTRFVRAAELRYSTGETNRLAKIAAEGKHQEVVLLKEQTLTDVEIYKHRLQHIMNLDTAVQIMQKDLGTVNIAFVADTASTGLNPLLNYYKQRIELARRQYKLQKSEFVPDFSVGYFNQKIEGISGATGFSLGIGIPLDFWAKSGRTQAAEVSVAIAGAEYDSYSLRLKTIFENYIQDFVKYQAQVNYYLTKGLELAEELENFAGRGYVSGEIEYVEYIRNLDQANDIRNKYLETLRLYKQTKIEINYLMGIL